MSLARFSWIMEIISSSPASPLEKLEAAIAKIVYNG
jgi:hypothetical protein